MPSPSSIRDNRPARGAVGDFLKSEIQPGSDLSFVSAYFTVHAYAALAHQLEHSARLRFLFGEPSFISGIGQDEKKKANFKLTETGLQLGKTLTQSNAAKACADWIERLVGFARSGRQISFTEKPITSKTGTLPAPFSEAPTSPCRDSGSGRTATSS